MADYQITLSERQALVLRDALELAARLGIGQWGDALEYLPFRPDRDYPTWHEAREIIRELMRAHLVDGIDGYSASLSIHDPRVSTDALVAWDLYQVIRHGLAWERAVRDGLVATTRSPRQWPAMFAVDYDEPTHTAEEPLATILKVPTPGSRPAGADTQPAN